MPSTALYVDTAQLREQLDRKSSDRDSVLEGIISAVSRTIDRVCNRPDGFVAASTATARLFAANGGAVLWIDEAAAITLVEAKASTGDSTYTAWASTDWLPGSGDPRLPDFNATPYQWIMTERRAGHGALRPVGATR
jgi:hypothetical protein